MFVMRDTTCHTCKFRKHTNCVRFPPAVAPKLSETGKSLSTYPVVATQMRLTRKHPYQIVYGDACHEYVKAEEAQLK